MTDQSPIIYRSETGAIELRQDSSTDTIWATQKQMAEIFEVQVPAIAKHLKNIFQDEELQANSVISNLETTAQDGKKYKTNFYNLDAIISVGYRVNSKTATKFRQWATQTLRSHIVEGYTINPTRITQNHEAFLKAIEDTKQLLPNNANIKADDVLDLVNLFAHTWLSLDAYDKSELPASGSSKSDILFTAEELESAIAGLKENLIEKNEATELFAQAKNQGSLGGIVGSVFQSAFGQDAYPTIEEKAAHLLYFIIKNHPFNDGNKRSGAFAFVWFLSKAKILNTDKITPEALTALTLLIAESDPKDKDRMVGLVLLLLRN